MRFLTTFVLILGFTTALAQAEIAVVVNPANANAVSSDDLNRLFLGRASSFADGSKATPLNLAEGQAAREEFDSKVLNRSSAQLKAYWSKLVFTGKGTPPKELADDAAVKAAVAGDSTAIGYISSGSVDGSVKVVATF
ncbi:MAG: phosphate ABC transporter substrate-binding protein [Gammaproteobacteria bacterium]|nr:phosphate ABC transporter substrate-binding protein [Gammaproteobacteria bacterium]MBU1553836.1 phosphate ABC transporter substrate-binding protein [Gammaproteobacteria bacterium]MBU2068689.1 phosphate ABC transporter substrate-binding protein [Gammaproteobacteria bacterium]MBU2183707.1 phosphate ABC transporter substrate-binding protein [Gammaproteobacteria bacterium]MBU2205926.1 phosphate ABC transporter substrate-binding protein [Gammaproteobacteria bacterium]